MDSYKITRNDIYRLLIDKLKEQDASIGEISAIIHLLPSLLPLVRAMGRVGRKLQMELTNPDE